MSLAFGVGNMTMKKIMVDKCELESQTVKKKRTTTLHSFP